MLDTRGLFAVIRRAVARRSRLIVVHNVARQSEKLLAQLLSIGLIQGVETRGVFTIIRLKQSL